MRHTARARVPFDFARRPLQRDPSSPRSKAAYAGRASLGSQRLQRTQNLRCEACERLQVEAATRRKAPTRRAGGADNARPFVLFDFA